MVIDRKQGNVTKHYYNGTSRIASRVGGGFSSHPDLTYDPLNDHIPLPSGLAYEEKSQTLITPWTRNADCAGLNEQMEFSYSMDVAYQFTNAGTDGERYFYHSDHLGSSAFITSEMRSIREDRLKISTTEQNGYATQYLAYSCTEPVERVPYGETLAEEQNSTSYYSPFKFSAKERDPETGYSYFGARYYSPELSVWLSVDPMSDKYPSLSPYNYCAWNPVMLIDPDGREIEEGSQGAWNGHKNNITSKIEALKTLSSILGSSSSLAKNVNARIESLNCTLEGMQIMEESSQCYRLSQSDGNYGSTSMTSDGVINIATNGQTSNFVHEVTHGIQYENNQLAFFPGLNKSISSRQNEVEAYRAEFAYQGSLTPGINPGSPNVRSFSDINPNWVGGIISGGLNLYSMHGLLPVNPNLGQAGINASYPNNRFLVKPDETLRIVYPTAVWKR